MLDKEELLPVVEPMIAGYTKVKPLLPAEQKLLHTLAASRLCQSVIMSAYSFSRDPTNTYLLVTSRPGWVALGKLMAMTPEEIKMFNAC